MRRCPLLDIQIACSPERPLCGWCDFSCNSSQQSARSNVSQGEGIKVSPSGQTQEKKPCNQVKHAPQEQKPILLVCRCGDSFKPASNRQKLCPKCGKENEARGTKDRVANFRKKKRGEL